MDTPKEPLPLPASDLFGVEAEKRRADQLGLNCTWLVDKIDRIHAVLCPGQFGTWQQRAEQAVNAAESLTPKARSRRHQNDMSNQQRPETEKRGSHSSPPSCSADRVIIGESLQAGWPISASVYHPDGKGDFGMPPMRWVKRLDSTFALECYVFGQSKWVEVPLWNSQPNTPGERPLADSDVRRSQ